MKNGKYLPFLALFLGLVCAGARWTLFRNHTDALGLLETGTYAELCVWLLTGLCLVLFALVARTGLGVAEGTSPTHFTDCGRMFRSTEIGVQNSIDPCYVEEGRRKYLVWGSFSGLYMGQLSKDGKQLKRPNELTQLAGKAFEGAMIFKRGGYYYLFASVGTCCEGERSTYRTVVGRSRRLAGPYVE